MCEYVLYGSRQSPYMGSRPGRLDSKYKQISSEGVSIIGSNPTEIT